jgi:hypothetical protein
VTDPPTRPLFSRQPPRRMPFTSSHASLSAVSPKLASSVKSNGFPELRAPLAASRSSALCHTPRCDGVSLAADTSHGHEVNGQRCASALDQVSTASVVYFRGEAHANIAPRPFLARVTTRERCWSLVGLGAWGVNLDFKGGVGARMAKVISWNPNHPLGLRGCCVRLRREALWAAARRFCCCIVRLRLLPIGATTRR